MHVINKHKALAVTALFGFAGMAALSLPAMADDLDDLLGGFDEPSAAPIVQVEANPAEPTGPWHLSGETGLMAAYAYDHGSAGSLPFTNNLAHLIADAKVQMDYRGAGDVRGQLVIKGQYDAAYALNGSSNYTTATLENYESEVEIDQAWIQTSVTDNLDVKFGRQQLVLGKMDMVTVNDRVHALDNRYPGLSDIDDLRQPLLMTRLDYYLADWQATMAISHEVRAPKSASLGVDVFPSSAFSTQVLSNMPALNDPLYSWGNTPYMLAMSGTVGGWDMAFYHGRVLDSRWHQVTSPAPAREYGTIQQTGAAASAAVGSWLWKLEAAQFSDLAFSNVTGLKQRTDLAVGFDYNGWSDVVWSLELASRNLADFEANMAALPNWQVENDLQLVSAVQYQFNHNRSKLTLMANYYGDDLQGGAIHKLLWEHELSQNVQLEVGLIDYASGAAVTAQALSSSDKLMVGIKRQF